MKRDLQQLLIASRAFVLHDDFRKVIVSLNKILSLNDSSDLDRNALAKYLKQVLKGGAPLADSRTLKGMLLSLASIDKSLITGKHGVIAGLNLMASNNIYGQNRKLSDLNTSALRSLLFMIACADLNASLEVGGKDTGSKPLLLVDSSDHPSREPGTVRDQTTNIAEWYVGEMVTAVRWGREGKIPLNGKYVHMNQYQAYDWMLYRKRYQLSGIGRIPLKFTGASGILTDEIVKTFLPPGAKDTVIALIELGGGMSDAEYAGRSYTGFTSTSWKDRYGTGGRRHKVLALFNPILEFLWNARDARGGQRAGDFIRVIRGLNEIPVANYQPLFVDDAPNRNATLRHDDQFNGRSVIKSIEDNRLLSVVSRSHGSNDNGLLAPALDILTRIVAKLNQKDSVPADYLKAHPAFRGNTALEALFEEVQTKGVTSKPDEGSDLVEKAIQLLFVPKPNERLNAVAKAQGYVEIIEQTIELFRRPSAQTSSATNHDAANGISGAE